VVALCGGFFGGAISAGFAAAILLRGVRFRAGATSLIGSGVRSSSVGGNTVSNSPQEKLLARFTSRFRWSRNNRGARSPVSASVRAGYSEVVAKYG